MTTVEVFCASLLFLGICAAASNDAGPVFACNLKAISAADRPRYNELVKRIRASVRSRSEIADGYTYHLDDKTVSLIEAAEWMSMERLCCPFLSLKISTSGDQSQLLLALSGPEGVKPLLNSEFPIC
jgi:hypothetical protein